MAHLPTVKSGEAQPQAELDAASEAFLVTLKTGGGAPEGTSALVTTPRLERRVRGDSYSDLVELVSSLESPVSRDVQRSVLAAATWPPPPHTYGPIVVVSSYTCFDDLAHGPRGTQAERAMRTYRLNMLDGSLTLLSAVAEGAMHNPAFSRRHPSLNVVYACTESVKQEGQVVAMKLDGATGKLVEHCAPVGAGGTSTCYLTIHKNCRRMLLVNYWNSTVCTLEMMPDGQVGRLMATYDPNGGKEMKAKADSHVNHSRNDAAAQAERQGDPHSHAIVLEPTTGNIAYVPDLGMDLIRQFHFDEETGVVTPCGEIISGVKTGGRALGPRYITFAKEMSFCYVVNELSSQVAVFEYNAEATEEIVRAAAKADTADAKVAALKNSKPTLTLIQTVSTIPEAFPREMNTCGRVTVHPTVCLTSTCSLASHRSYKFTKSLCGNRATSWSRPIVGTTQSPCTGSTTPPACSRWLEFSTRAVRHRVTSSSTSLGSGSWSRTRTPILARSSTSTAPLAWCVCADVKSFCNGSI